MAGGRHNEEEDAFIRVLRAAAADAERVGEVSVEGGRFDDGVDFAAAEADAGGVFSDIKCQYRDLENVAKCSRFTYSKHHRYGRAW